MSDRHRARLYRAAAWGTLAAGVGLTGAALLADPLPSWLWFAVLALACLVTDAGHLTLPYAGSVAFGVVASLPAVLVLGPGYAAVCGGIAQLVINARRRRPVPTLVFNTSQRALCLVLAGAAWNAAESGRLSLGPAHPALHPDRVLVAALACLAVYTVATHLLVSVYSATRRAQPVWTVLAGNASLRVTATATLGSFGLLTALLALQIDTAPPHREYALVVPVIAGLMFLIYGSNRQTNQQLVRLYTAGTDLVQAGDLDQLLQRTADVVERLAVPAALWVALRTDGRLEAVVSRGIERAAAQPLADALTRDLWGPRPDGSARFVRIADHARAWPEPLLVSGERVRSVMLAPLAAGSNLVGTVGVVHSIPDYFIAAQDRAVAMLAAQAAFAVNYLRLYRESQAHLARAETLQARNADLLRESQRRAHQLALLNRAFVRVATPLSTEEVFTVLVDELHSTLGYPYVSLHVVDGDALRLVADRGYTAAEKGFPISRGIAGRVARTGQPALVFDVRRDPDYIASHPLVTQQASAPITSRGAVAGVITVESIEPVLASADLELLITLAGYATLAIENARHYEEARTLATTDVLTGLPNRRMLWPAFERELARAERYGTPLSVVMVEVDRFKQYNDTHGHLRGDDALRHVAAVLLQQHRAQVDVVARYGGDEFVALLPQAAKAEAAAAAERIRRAVVGRPAKGAPAKGPAAEDGNSAPGVTVSLGVASFPDDGRTIEALLRAADRSMYAAKATGGDAVAVAPRVVVSVERPTAAARPRPKG
ncbi:MAG TPA: sensor domain-containing diguanylate cyclase [bacterium]|nr:sensor domain-containing diguanylate cyclase [bacterium]